MVRMVIAVDVAPGHEAEWEEQWRMMRNARRDHPGFRGASLLRDSAYPTHYLALSEWDEHVHLAQAMRGMLWINRDETSAWTTGPIRVYDEIVESIGEAADIGD